MFKKMLLAMALSIASFYPVQASQEDYGTRDEAIAMMEKVVAHFEENGLDQTIAAIMDANNADFHDRDLYAFIFDMEGTTLGHGVNPKLVGKNLMSLEDQKGVRLVYEFTEIAKTQGSGWLTYHWVNPVTKKIEEKQTYIVRLGDGALAGVGIYSQ